MSQRERERRSRLVQTLVPRVGVGLGRAGMGLGCAICLWGGSGSLGQSPKKHFFWTTALTYSFKQKNIRKCVGEAGNDII